jgi:sec-independent protein translocase protein TatC
MLRMSFLGHLEELRRRIFLMVIGVAVAFALSLTFSNPLWIAVQAPATAALTTLGIHPPNLVAITPMEAFNIIWFKLPTLAAIFLASPWIVYQVWAFISPGLYKKERRFAAPFILFSAGLFILGGCFAYFVAFRFGITFLLGVGRDVGITPMVSMSEYFDLFVNVMLGIGLVFELPVIIFFLTLIRVVSPKFLIAHSRYAILGIVIVAAIVTPTPDIFNLLLFAVPMCMLFYVGIFASYVLVLKREGRSLPWTMIMGIIALIVVAGIAAFLIATRVMHYHFIQAWPFLTR